MPRRLSKPRLRPVFWIGWKVTPRTQKAQLKKARYTFVTELYDPFKVMGTIHYGASIDVPDPTVKKAL